jgi:uncharacterized OB-fold protein
MTDPIKVMPGPVRLEYTVIAGRHLSRYLRALAEGRLIGGRCPACRKVYVPPRGACPTCALPTDEEVAVSDRGTVTTFCVINISFGNAALPPPYAAASVLLDGADIPIFHLIGGTAVENVRMGLRVRAVWVEKSELGPTLESIRWFEPSGEPDADYASYREHL